MDLSFQVGALEPQFYSELLKGLEMNSDDLPQFGDTEELRRKRKPKTYFSDFFFLSCAFSSVLQRPSGRSSRSALKQSGPRFSTIRYEERNRKIR